MRKSGEEEVEALHSSMLKLQQEVSEMKKQLEAGKEENERRVEELTGMKVLC